MAETLRYIFSGSSNGFVNMAVDELLLDECRSGKIGGALRVYEWSPPCVSIGHGQPVESADPERCAKAGVDVVRRITGGGAILHFEEITYCIAMRREVVPQAKWPRQFAGLVADSIRRALDSVGVDASRSDALARGVRQSRLCFSSNSENEIVVRDRKLAGCAHKFTKEAFFSHGSIMLGASHLRIVELMREETCASERKLLAERSTCLGELLDPLPEREALGRELKRGVESVFGVTLSESRFTPEEKRAAIDLSLSKKIETQSMRNPALDSRQRALGERSQA